LASIDSAGVFLHSGKRTDLPVNIPDIQIEWEDGVNANVYGCQPNTQIGTVKLASSNPRDAPLIYDPAVPPAISNGDLQSLAWAVGAVQKILSTDPIRSIMGNRTAPPDSLISDAQILKWVTDNVQSGNHMVGTCRMGDNSGPLNVVDHELRVNGVQGLRIADASIMPYITNGNLQATIMAIAEKAADMIKTGARIPVSNQAKLVL